MIQIADKKRNSVFSGGCVTHAISVTAIVTVPALFFRQKNMNYYLDTEITNGYNSNYIQNGSQVI